MNHLPPLLLASSSPYRARLLRRLGLDFETRNPAVDESPRRDEDARPLSRRLAEAKALAGHHMAPDAVVIGSDQVASLGGARLGKPGGLEPARDQLRRASGRAVDFDTSVAVCAPDGRLETATVPFRVHFRELGEPEIDAYLTAEQPWDCAGSFRAEGLGICLFERLEGEDPTALIGLPLIALSRMLRKLGYPLPA